MRRPAAFALAALLLASSPARADYTFDPADLPKGFECVPVKDAPNGADSTGEADCPRERREEAWWNRHGEAYDRWFHELAFNPDLYFADEPPDPRDRASHAETPNLVDAVYAIALQRYGGWAFAVDMACAEVPAGKRVDKASCAPKLRMVSMRRGDEIDPASQGRLAAVMPTTRDEVAAQLVVTARWEEADLRTCKGAMDQLLALPAQRGEPLWHPGYVKWLRGQPPAEKDDLQITLDGAGVRLRARGMEDPVSSAFASGGRYAWSNRWNGGADMAWAQTMARVVKPCLKPAAAPAPWTKALRARSGSGD